MHHVIWLKDAFEYDLKSHSMCKRKTGDYTTDERVASPIKKYNFDSKTSNDPAEHREKK
jgi:hypothetical protein